jgi:ABC-type branched-subunit amino acid transport system permease subunit
VKDFLPYIIIGITAGSIYGLSAMGLVLTYKTSGVFNLAHGAIGAAAAYTFLELRQERGLPWPIAAVISVLVLGVLVGLVMERLAAGLARVSTAYRIVATVGLLLGILALLRLIFGQGLLFFDTFLSREPAFTVQGVRVSIDSVVIFAIGTLAAVALSLLFRRTRIGTAMRAVVDDPQLLDLTGDSPTAVRRCAWLIGTCFAALSGVLFAELQQGVDAVLLSFLVVQTFGAAAIGAFTNLPRAYMGGILVGLIQAVTSKLITGHESLQGLDSNVPFVILLIALIFLPRKMLVEVGAFVKAKAAPPGLLGPQSRIALGSVLAVSLLVPFVVGSKLPIWTSALSQVVLFASLGLLVHSSGQISLSQWGFAAVGGVSFAHMLAQGLPWGLAVLVAALITVPVGALISLPAIRLSGLYLGLATLGFGVLLAGFFYQKDFFFGVKSNLDTRRPSVLGLDTDKGFYYLLLAIVVLVLIFVVTVERSRLGRLLRGLADSPTALSTLGTNINQTRMIVFSISAFLAGLAGAMYSSMFGSINVDTFNYIVSIQVLAVLVVSGRSTLTSSIVAPILFVVIPGYISNPTFALYQQLAFGVLAVAVALLSQTSLRELFAGQKQTDRPDALDRRSASTTSDRLALLAPVNTRRA